MEDALALEMAAESELYLVKLYLVALLAMKHLFYRRM